MRCTATKETWFTNQSSGWPLAATLALGSLHTLVFGRHVLQIQIAKSQIDTFPPPPQQDPFASKSSGDVDLQGSLTFVELSYLLGNLAGSVRQNPGSLVPELVLDDVQVLDHDPSFVPLLLLLFCLRLRLLDRLAQVVCLLGCTVASRLDKLVLPRKSAPVPARMSAVLTSLKITLPFLYISASLL